MNFLNRSLRRAALTTFMVGASLVTSFAYADGVDPPAPSSSAPVAAFEFNLERVQAYQAKAESDCVEAGRVDGRRPPGAVQAYCTCVFSALKASMTLLEWQAAYDFSLIDRRAEWSVFEKRGDQVVRNCASRTL
jgi:hypothetical protein